jgi:uncharacterized damage-inducible protein DinB
MTPNTLEVMKLAWTSNQNVNEVLLDHLTDPAMMHAKTPGGGYTVAQHLAHMVEVLVSWTSQFEPSVLSVPELYSDWNEAAPQDFTAETDVNRVRDVMVQAHQAAWAAAEHATSTGKLPHASIPQYLIHMMIHDAHHRGQILLALKTNGFALPDDGALWSPLKAARP